MVNICLIIAFAVFLAMIQPPTRGAFLAVAGHNNKSKIVENDSSKCRYHYPNYIPPYIITCQNMNVNEIPFHRNVTELELIQVPLAVLNDSLIPQAIRSEWVNLHQLHWTKSYIKLIEKVSIPSLTELDVSENSIQEIKFNSMQPLTNNLKKLNVSHNLITALPYSLFGDENTLTVLSLSYNLLQSIPVPFLQHLKNLEILDVSNNGLTSIKEDLLYGLDCLINLNLAHNKITIIPAGFFSRSRQLQYLSLEGNNIISIDSITFSRLHHLMVLNLSYNPFMSLPSSLLPVNNTLFILSISYTKMITMKSDTFVHLRSLRSLEFSHNPFLQHLANDTFSNTINLKNLNLRYNNLTNLPGSIMDLKLDELRLDGNPWPCDCRTQWIPIWFQDTNQGNGRLYLGGKCNHTHDDLLQSLFGLKCKPRVLQISPPPNYHKPGSKVQLGCKAISSPSPVISWITPSGFVYTTNREDVNTNDDSGDYNRDIAMMKNSRGNAGNSANIVLYDNGDLEVNQLSEDDAGQYTCIALNQYGETAEYTEVLINANSLQTFGASNFVCAILWINTILIFSIVFMLVRRYARKTKRVKRSQRIQRSMDAYKTQQIIRLKDRTKNQMMRVKNNCSIQVEWIKENFKESAINKLPKIQTVYTINRYHNQMTETRLFYIDLVQQIYTHYNKQYSQIFDFKLDNGENIGNPDFITTEIIAPISDDEIYTFSESVIRDIQMLTSFRNLQNIENINEKIQESQKLEDCNVFSNNNTIIINATKNLVDNKINIMGGQ